MDVHLFDLLKKCNNDESTTSTHSTSYGPAQRFCISENHYEKFWESYCEMAENPETNTRKLCLAETPQKYMPIIVDLTLKFHPLETSEEIENDEFIIKLVYCYQQIIKETMKVSTDNQELICCVMKAEDTVEHNLIIQRIRLQFPYCKMLAQMQSRNIRPLVIPMLRAMNAISLLSSQPVNDWEDIIDPLTVEHAIHMYGSSATQNIPKLILEYIYPMLDEYDQTPKTLDLETAFHFQNHEHISNGIINKEFFKKIDATYDFWLPYFLSIYYVKQLTLSKKSTPVGIVSKKEIIFTEHENQDENSLEYLSSKFLRMLDRKRKVEEHYWLDVGKALHSVYRGSERGLEKWIEFSEADDDVFTEDQCRVTYYNFQPHKTTIKTLAYYAQEDSAKEYKEWHNTWCRNALQNCSSCTHVDVATAVYRCYWLQFACSNLSKGTMYEFRNHFWKLLDAGHIVKQILSGPFIDILEAYRTDLCFEAQQAQDIHRKESANAMITKIVMVINKLKNRTFKSAVFGETAEKFYVEDFEDTLDSAPNLIGCRNGIIEALDTKAVFRDGKPEDHISRTTGVCYKHDMHEKHPLYLKLMIWLGKVFPDKDLLNHFGKLIGSGLRGRNVDKIFPIHTGSGNNSKSMIKKIIECSFNSYVITLMGATFTGGRSAGPDPSIARSKYAHWAFIQEPDVETPLKSGIIKEMTGGDKFYVRALHSNGGEIDPMFTLHMQCNNVPIIPQCDAAIRNRVKIIPYLSVFTLDPPKTAEEQLRKKKFLLDPHFHNQIPEMAPAFLFYCIKMYEVYCQEGLVDPEIVIEHTQKYWEENDLYALFIKENLEKVYKKEDEEIENNTSIEQKKTDKAGTSHNKDNKAAHKKKKPQLDEKVFVPLAEIYKVFKCWYKDNFSSMRIPDRSVLRGELETRLCKSVKRNYHGIKIKIPTPDDKDI